MKPRRRGMDRLKAAANPDLLQASNQPRPCFSGGRGDNFPSLQYRPLIPAPRCAFASAGAAVSSLRCFTALRHTLPPIPIYIGFRMRPRGVPIILSALLGPCQI
jgi:hypothetical protein